MMKKISFKFLLLIVSCIFMSCENDIMENSFEMTDTHNEFIFFYRGEKYNGELIQTKSGEEVFIDSRVDILAGNFKNNPELATFVNPDGTIEYFDNQEDLKNKLDNIPVIFSSGINRTIGGTLTVYQKDKRGGRSILKTLNTSTKSIQVSCEELSSANMHDEISSIVITCQFVDDPMFDFNHSPNKCVAIFYEHEKFGGNSIWFAADPIIRNKTVDYLKDIPLYPGSKRNWNDQISSYKFSYPNY